MNVLFILKESVMIERIGVMYLSAALKKRGHGARLVMADTVGIEGLKGVIRDYKPRIVAYSVMTGEHVILAQLNRSLKKEFDFIIFDTPPVAIVTDTLLLAPYVDVNIFIVRQRYSSRNTLELIEQMHHHGELKNMAIVMNDITLLGYYGYGMRYGYMQGYGFLYGNAYYGSNYYGRYRKSDKSKGYYREE